VERKNGNLKIARMLKGPVDDNQLFQWVLEIVGIFVKKKNPKCFPP
jgi:hypothetical protein